MGFHVEQLSVRYGPQWALQDVSLRFDTGALGLLGPNGAGKSSLLRTLLGFVTPVQGTVQVLGQPIGRDAYLLRRRIGYHPEDDVLIPGMNAVGSVALCGQLAGLKHSDALQRAHEILYFVGLGEVRYRQATTYSQGMRQRLKLAQALVHDPELLILDEPTNGLDPTGRAEMLKLIRDLAVAKGIHLVLSSHLLPDVEAVCDQVVLLDQGRILASGRMEDLLRAAHAAYEVRVKGEREAFEAALVSRGGTCEATPRGLLLVQIPGRGVRLLFEAAQESRCQIRQLTPARQSLGEMFAHTVAGRTHAHP
ncbi:MAG TPA: ABC transporter ATP-binding protein [Candidatus Krumholzibacteria bacterium]|nr:ABC transporter ATP-binding protein [Candidatus Krumholzibacteria bacterium]